MPIESELGTCLRLAECEPATPRVVPKAREEDVIFDLWHVAQQDIQKSWMRETDLANLNRRLADFSSANQSTEMDVGRVNAVLVVVESPWPGVKREC